MLQVFEPPEHLVVARTEGWIVGQRVDSCLPGYLMIAARTPTVQLAEMPDAALAELGHVAAKAQAAVEAILAPAFVYVARFGHDPGFQFHFHIIPVCDWLMERYLADPKYAPVHDLRQAAGWDGANGAEITLYVWRDYCRNPSPPPIPGPSVDDVIARAKAFFV